MSEREDSFRKPAGEDAMDQEIGFHIAELTEVYVAQGLSPDEARRRAMLEFGGREQVKQQVREVHISRLLETMVFNLKAAVRFLRKSPLFSIVVILTLGARNRRQQRGVLSNRCDYSSSPSISYQQPTGCSLSARLQRARRKYVCGSGAPGGLEPTEFNVSGYQRILLRRSLGNVGGAAGEGDGVPGCAAISGGNGSFARTGARVHATGGALGRSKCGGDQLRVLAAAFPWRSRCGR